MLYNICKTIKSSPSGLVNVPLGVPMEEKVHGHKETKHRKLEGIGLAFSILTFVAIAIGSVIEIIPTLSMHRYVKTESIVDPFTPLELAGRDIYIKEGCYACHSQMIRKLPFDVLRYGKASTVEESMYNRPFQWGSKELALI